MANHTRLADRSLTESPFATAWNETHVKSVAALLRGHGTAVVYSPGLHWQRRLDSVRLGTQVALKSNTLPTTRIQYSLVKRVIDILLVCAMLPCLIPLVLLVALCGPSQFHGTTLLQPEASRTFWA